MQLCGLQSHVSGNDRVWTISVYLSVTDCCLAVDCVELVSFFLGVGVGGEGEGVETPMVLNLSYESHRQFFDSRMQWGSLNYFEYRIYSHL